MLITRAGEATTYETHGSRFESYACSATGSRELSGWRLVVPPNLTGAAHRPSREEILLVLIGQMRMTLDGTTADLNPGDVAIVPAGSEFRVDTGPAGLTAWVTTTVGLQAVTADGTVLRPPWAQ